MTLWLDTTQNTFSFVLSPACCAAAWGFARLHHWTQRGTRSHCWQKYFCHFSTKCRTLYTIMWCKVVKNFVIHNTAVTNVSCQSGCAMLSSLLACLSIVTSVAVRHPEPFPLLQRRSLSICCLSQAQVDGHVHMSCTVHFPNVIIFRLCSVVCVGWVAQSV